MQKLLYNISRLVTMEPHFGSGVLGVIERAAVLFDEQKILWCGQENGIPSTFSVSEKINAQAAVLCPGLIDCHTHLVHGGFRQHEFKQRA